MSAVAAPDDAGGQLLQDDMATAQYVGVPSSGYGHFATAHTATDDSIEHEPAGYRYKNSHAAVTSSTQTPRGAARPAPVPRGLGQGNAAALCSVQQGVRRDRQEALAELADLEGQLAQTQVSYVMGFFPHRLSQLHDTH